MSSLKSFKLSQLAEILGAELEGDPSKEIIGINTLETSLDQEVSFIARDSYLTKLSTTKAGAVICNTDYSELFTGNKLICENPYLTYARCTELFKEKPAIETGISSLAVIEDMAIISDTASIGNFVTVSENAVIEDEVVLMPGVFIGEGCRIGKGSIIYANVSIYDSVNIGEECILHS